MIMTGLMGTNIVEANFGKIQYNVNFDRIICNKNCFITVNTMADETIADIKTIKLYGDAITAAENIKSRKWILTDEGNLVSYHCDDIDTLTLGISIDANVKILSSPDYGECTHHCVDVQGMRNGSEHGMWCIFL